MQRTSWFGDHRIAWIVEVAGIYGYINRSHIQRKFDISEIQASNDLQRVLREHPGALEYDASAGHYRYTGD